MSNEFKTVKKIKNKREYRAVMKAIDELLEKSSKAGGLTKLDKPDSEMLANLSKIAETYEDKVLKLMPIRK